MTSREMRDFVNQTAVLFSQQSQHGTVVQFFIKQKGERLGKMRNFQFNGYAVGIADAFNGDDFCLWAQVEKGNILFGGILNDRFDHLCVSFAPNFPAHVGKAAGGNNVMIVFFLADKGSFSLLA